ncbi:hypothetical protein [Micromonospora sp. ATCC 39149]|uniref:hypothetical protein n=1 Tax=Micromonospora sp. (strain ATCC 39149 / NRRL 15099 / SCC 1413) TaxID=219305 RepID=UPI0012FBD42B|nr:hypothetical protein [Micromonospora sp. ATCC 39149]
MTARQLTPHLYQPDGDLPADHTGDRPCTCRLPRRHARHQLPDAPPAQTEHRRRIGDED